MTAFFPNRWIDRARQRYVAQPDRTRLELWFRARERFAGVPAGAPPLNAGLPVTH